MSLQLHSLDSSCFCQIDSSPCFFLRSWSCDRWRSGVLPRPRGRAAQLRHVGKQGSEVFLSGKCASTSFLSSSLRPSSLPLSLSSSLSSSLPSYLPSSLPSTYPLSPPRPLSYVLIGCCGRLAGYICSSADGGAAFSRSSCLCAAGGTGDGDQLK